MEIEFQVFPYVLAPGPWAPNLHCRTQKAEDHLRGYTDSPAVYGGKLFRPVGIVGVTKFPGCSNESPPLRDFIFFCFCSLATPPTQPDGPSHALPSYPQMEIIIYPAAVNSPWFCDPVWGVDSFIAPYPIFASSIPPTRKSITLRYSHGFLSEGLGSSFGLVRRKQPGQDPTTKYRHPVRWFATVRMAFARFIKRVPVGPPLHCFSFFLSSC